MSITSCIGQVFRIFYERCQHVDASERRFLSWHAWLRMQGSIWSSCQPRNIWSWEVTHHCRRRHFADWRRHSVIGRRLFFFSGYSSTTVNCVVQTCCGVLTDWPYQCMLGTLHVCIVWQRYLLHWQHCSRGVRGAVRPWAWTTANKIGNRLFRSVIFAVWSHHSLRGSFHVWDDNSIGFSAVCLVACGCTTSYRLQNDGIF